MKFLKKYFLQGLFLSGLLFTTASCDDHFFENEGDCEVTHAIKFVYNMNLKWADAFSSEVKSVNLYVFDNNGLFVKEYTGAGEELSEPDYKIMLDLPTNRTYQFLAWCGLVNEGVTVESFVVPEPVVGVTTIEDMTCTLQALEASLTKAGEGNEVISDTRLDFLYHGYISQFLEDKMDGSHYEYTMYLIKDTSHVRVMLQQTTGSLEAEDFDISMQAANGQIGWNNELVGDTEITYLPWNMQTDILGIGNSNGEVNEYYGVVADLSTSRLMYDQVDDIFLTVKKRETGELLFKVPMIQYSLTELEYYEMAYGHTITPQEFLDRQDEYIMTFFLDENMNWLYAMIEVLQWRVVIRNYSAAQ